MKLSMTNINQMSLRNNSLPTSNESGLGIVDHEQVLDAIAKTTDTCGKYHIYTPEIRFKIRKFASEINNSMLLFENLGTDIPI